MISPPVVGGGRPIMFVVFATLVVLALTARKFNTQCFINPDGTGHCTGHGHDPNGRFAGGRGWWLANRADSPPPSPPPLPPPPPYFDCDFAAQSPNPRAPGAARAGCASAVWSSGNPAESYCKGSTNPWFAACCSWEDNTCKARGSVWFAKSNDKSCDHRTQTLTVSKLGEAMAICNQDDSCRAVYDYKDDNQRNFILCGYGFTLSQAGNAGGAVYVKEEEEDETDMHCEPRRFRGPRRNLRDDRGRRLC